MADLVYRYLGFWVGFQLGPSEKGLYILPHSMVEHGRIGIPGNFMVLEVRIA